MITGTIQFIVEIDVEEKDEESLNVKSQETKTKIENALPNARIESGDDDLEDVDD